MRQAARAIIIRDNKLAVIKRNKFGSVYYTLVGGGIEEGETPEQAVRREVLEETGLQVHSVRHVFIEDSETYGQQLIFLCDAAGEVMQLAPGTDEYRLTQEGKNTYEPMWLALEQAESVEFRSPKLIKVILSAIQNGFPEAPLRV